MSKRRLPFSTDESGAVLPISALSLVALLGFSAFAIDFGFAYTRQSQLQSVADSKALACAQNYTTCKSGATNIR